MPLLSLILVIFVILGLLQVRLGRTSYIGMALATLAYMAYAYQTIH